MSRNSSTKSDAPGNPPLKTEPDWLVTFPYKYLLKRLDPATYARKRWLGICGANGCARKAAPKRCVCETCRSRINRIRNELGYVYRAVKESARKRSIAFHLTREEFRQFCARTGYLKRRGQKEGAMSIDRIDHSKGYSADNIQLTEWLENSTKKNTPHPPPPVIDEEAPFGW